MKPDPKPQDNWKDVLVGIVIVVIVGYVLYSVFIKEKPSDGLNARERMARGITEDITGKPYQEKSHGWIKSLVLLGVLALIGYGITRRGPLTGGGEPAPRKKTIGEMSVQELKEELGKDHDADHGREDGKPA